MVMERNPMEWKILLSEKKLPKAESRSIKPDDPKAWSRYPINPFEQDYNKIVNSAAFRRLQDKTQVFPLSKSDFVRTRLTHSIEVSTIAYQLGEMLIHNEYKKATEDIKIAKEEMAKDDCKDIPSVLRCAGLIHDLGNPPFGHFGEETIGNWFRENLDKIEYKGNTLRTWLKALNENGEDEIKEEIKPALQRYLKARKEKGTILEDKYPVAFSHKKLGDEAIADLEHFEGNAQALRLLCKAQYAGDINVTYAVISSLIKYPTTSLAFLAYKRDKEENEKKKDWRDDIKLHKPGVYAAEKKVFDAVSDAVGTKLGDGTYCRHPLTYLMEASDDIAYATSDLEDSFKKKLFTLDEFIRYYNTKLEEFEGPEKTESELNKIKEELKKHRDALKENKAKLEKEALAEAEKSYKIEVQRTKARTNLNTLTDMRQAAEGGKSSDAAVFSEWLYYIRRWLMYVVAYKFSNNYRAIMDGSFREDMFEGENLDLMLHILKGAMGKYVYDGESLAPTELSGRTILSFLLDGFVHAALYKDQAYADKDKEKYPDGPYKPSQENNKYLGLLSDTYKEDYDLSRTWDESTKTGDEAYDLYLRLLMVTDHISSMTDAYARDLFRSLRGME